MHSNRAPTGRYIAREKINDKPDASARNDPLRLLKSGMAMSAAGLILPAGMLMAQVEPRKGGVSRVGIGLHKC